MFRSMQTKVESYNILYGRKIFSVRNEDMENEKNIEKKSVQN